MLEVDNSGVILQLERVASAVSKALFAIARSEDGDAREALLRITQEAAALDALINPRDIGGAFQSASNPFTSPNVPDGYDTVLGYMYEANPGLFEIVDPRTAWAKDEAWIMAQSQKRGLPMAEVEASEFLKSHGVAKVKAYPRSLIREKLY